jgi:hypothetical protein
MSSSSSSASSRRGIRLRKSAQTQFVINHVSGFRFTVEAYEAYDMPNEIFLYLRGLLDPTTGEEADVFSNVCSSPDLEEYPAGAPTGVPQFFRLASVDLVFRSVHEADEAWDLIQREVAVLVETLNKSDVLAVAADVEIGGN